MYSEFEAPVGGRDLFYLTKYKTSNVLYVQRNIQAPSHIHCCCRKNNMDYTFLVCAFSLSYPECRTYARYYTVTCDMSGCTILFHIIS